MRFFTWLVVAAMLLCAAGSVLAQPGQKLSQPSGTDTNWRYRWHEGQWWYWTPQERWMVHRNGSWTDYAAAISTPSPGCNGSGAPYTASYGPTPYTTFYRSSDLQSPVSSQPYSSDGYGSYPEYRGRSGSGAGNWYQGYGGFYGWGTGYQGARR